MRRQGRPSTNRQQRVVSRQTNLIQDGGPADTGRRTFVRELAVGAGALSALPLHAVAPMIAVWDDHELANDTWMDGAENHQPDTEVNQPPEVLRHLTSW